MARKPTAPEKPLREWRVLILRDRTHYLGRVIAADKEAALDRAMEEFKIDAANRFRLIARRHRPSPSRQTWYGPPGMSASELIAVS